MYSVDLLACFGHFKDVQDGANMATCAFVMHPLLHLLEVLVHTFGVIWMGGGSLKQEPESIS